MFSEIQARLIRLNEKQHDPFTNEVIAQLRRQHYHGCFPAQLIHRWSEQYCLSDIDIALHCLAMAACYAVIPVSNFSVGAIAIGESGNFYFGANQEFTSTAIQQTVHAEQSAIMHAWMSGETAVRDVVVNYTPCGHCRQFMNELNRAENLRIHLPHSRHNALQDYLPDSFGPKDLNISKRLFDIQQQPFSPFGDSLTQAAIVAASLSYAPYSQAFSGVALQVGSQIITGRYAENAAFNPSFLPLQSALNIHRFSTLRDQKIIRIVMAEKQAVLSHRAISESLAENLGLTLEYVPID
ncbi:cytidine deaminase [Pasteurellaceae bacterium LIM206]|nr:cytidine deaminase [Pasteurellaceae bacterium LIM206]